MTPHAWDILISVPAQDYARRLAEGYEVVGTHGRPHFGRFGVLMARPVEGEGASE